jgi:hypothetical protein
MRRSRHLFAAVLIAAIGQSGPRPASGEWFPSESLFLPPIADPKQPRFFVSARQYDGDTLDAQVSAFGFGETFGIFRDESVAGAAWQIGLSGGLVGLLHLEQADKPLLNTDYLIGIPFTWRNEQTFLRLQIYHQSSHLGDDYLRVNPQRFIDFQYESAELLLGREWGRAHLYGGGEYLFHRHPTELAQEIWHVGVDYRRPRAWLGRIGLVAGVDVRWWRERPRAAVALTAGLAFGGTEPGEQRSELVLEAYSGYSPFGSFFVEDVNYWGIAFRVGF